MEMVNHHQLLSLSVFEWQKIMNLFERKKRHPSMGIVLERMERCSRRETRGRRSARAAAAVSRITLEDGWERE